MRNSQLKTRKLVTCEDPARKAWKMTTLVNGKVDKLIWKTTTFWSEGKTDKFA